MVVYEDYTERIKAIRAFFKMNKAEFADFTKTHASTLSDLESGNLQPSKGFMKTLSDIGISIDWFLSGTGEMLKPQKRLVDEKNLHVKASKEAYNGEKGIPLVFDGDKEFEDGIVIPVLGDNPVSAGHGEGVGDDEIPTRYIRVPRDLAKYPHLVSLPVRGDSMSPTLSDGDMVVCDGGGWDGDGIYVIKSIDETFVKRVQLTSSGYRIVSDNKLYESYTENSEGIGIVGRVRAMVVMVPGKRGGV